MDQGSGVEDAQAPIACNAANAMGRSEVAAMVE